jgi:hypothetical protein
MSLATLKKKTASKYKNNSANLAQFSINGVHRNQGYVGQTSLGRTMLRIPSLKVMVDVAVIITKIMCKHLLLILLKTIIM